MNTFLSVLGIIPKTWERTRFLIIGNARVNGIKGTAFVKPEISRRYGIGD